MSSPETASLVHGGKTYQMVIDGDYLHVLRDNVQLSQVFIGELVAIEDNFIHPDPEGPTDGSPA